MSNSQRSNSQLSDSQLTTAAYYAQALEAQRAAAQADAPPTATSPAPLTEMLSAPPAGAWERVTARLSLFVGAALAVSVMLLAIGYFAAARDRVNARAKHSTHTLDWFLWFGGAKDDQTFEKFLTDSAEKSRREWEERYRESPAYQANPQGVNWRNSQFKFEPAPLYKPPAGRGR
ncbi:MAG: hypothetical protein AB7O59_17770 [Pirellulales bacterium]